MRCGPSAPFALTTDYRKSTKLGSSLLFKGDSFTHRQTNTSIGKAKVCFRSVFIGENVLGLMLATVYDALFIIYDALFNNPFFF